MDFSQILSGVIERITGFFAKIKELFSHIKSIKLPAIKLPNGKISTPDLSKSAGRVKEFFSGEQTIFSKAKIFFTELTQHIPETKRRFLFISLGGLFGLLLVLLIAAIALKPGKQKSPSPAPSARGLNISPEELFIPAEPGFLPEFILEREPRRFWSYEEISRYWKMPERDNRWKEEIKSAVDKLMEGVP
jgi:hypothetical protein